MLVGATDGDVIETEVGECAIDGAGGDVRAVAVGAKVAEHDDAKFLTGDLGE